MSDNFLEIIKTSIPTLGTIAVSIISSYFVIKSARKTTENENKLKYLKQLEDFYYPLLLLLKKSSQLHDALNELGEIDNGGCLVHLLKGEALEGNSAHIFNEILLLDNDINDLILKHLKYVSNDDLRRDLTELSTHYSILFLANEGKLVDDVDVFAKFVYPTTIIDNIEKEIGIIENKAKD